MRSPSPSLVPLPQSTSCSCAPIWPPNLDRYLLLSSSYRLPHGCVVPRAKKIGISMIHKPPLTPSTKQQPTSSKYTSLMRCWISLVKLCKHRKKVLIYHSFVLVVTLSFGLPAIPLTCGWLNATRALSHKDRFRKNCKKLSTFIHSTSSSFGQELYMSSVKFRTNG